MKREIKLLFILVLCGITLWFIGINQPFVGSYGANLNYFTLAAKNFSRFGYLKLSFLPTYYVGGDLTLIPAFYLHHPVFYYSLVSIPFLIFGFKNWAAAITPLIFSLFTVYWLYKIGSFLGNKQRGLWTAVFAALFPIMTVFGRQTIFEPAILAILLGVYYFFLCYLRFKKPQFLILLTLLSFLGVMLDWGGAYFVFPFLLLYKFYPKTKEKKLAVLFYLASVFIGLGIFLTIVLLIKGNFRDLMLAVSSRQNNAELFSLSYPWVRLAGVSILRILIYFTPLSILAIYFFLKNLSQELHLKKITLDTLTAVFFLIFGLLNYIFLAAASFAHIYFLLYLLPFFALILGNLFSHLYIKRSSMCILLIITAFIFSSLVTYLKWQQVNKKVWRYEAAFKINLELIPFEEIAVKGFPGDIFEQYFFHATLPIESYEKLLDWLGEGKEGERKVVFSCWGDCQAEDLEFIESLPYKITKFDKAWLIENIEKDNLNFKKTEEINVADNNEETSYFLNIYRQIRNIFNVGQL